jgi:PAS domain S-box-containing protein
MKEEIRVLLIEDDAVHARLVRGMLEHDEMGIFTLNQVSTLGEGMRMLAPGSKIQLILLDLGLPDSSGLQTLREIMPLAQGASVVVITAQQDEKLAITALREGAQDYVIKGQVDGVQLRRILRYAVERHNLHSGLQSELDRSARVQQALQFSEQRYRLLSESSPMGILLSDDLGKIIDVNTQALRMFGYERRDLIGEPIELIVPERLRCSHQLNRAEFMKKPRARPVGHGKELLARRKDGTEFSVEIALVPLFTKEGVLVSSTIVDITDRKVMEEQVRLSHRMEAIGKLAGGVAHDFNNLLAVIMGSAEVAQDSLPPDHPAKLKIAVILQAATSAADLTRQLLAFSRQQMLNPQVIDLGQIVGRTETMLHHLIDENIHIRVRIEPALGQVKADPGQIERVLMNLALNARDAMPQGGHLTIESGNVELDDSYKDAHQPVISGNYVMLSVADSGCGMNRETQARIFDPFFTTKGSTKARDWA